MSDLKNSFLQLLRDNTELSHMKASDLAEVMATFAECAIPPPPESGELAKLREALALACTINKKLGEYIAGRTYLLPDDLAALKRFYECATDFDSGGHDVSKAAMARLREIGVVQSIGFGRHQTTSFGDFVIERDQGEPVKLPLKTLAERNADAARAALPQDLAKEGKA